MHEFRSVDIFVKCSTEIAFITAQLINNLLKISSMFGKIERLNCLPANFFWKFIIIYNAMINTEVKVTGIP